MSKGKFISIIVLLVTSLLAILYFQFNWILDINELNEDEVNTIKNKYNNNIT